MTAMLWDQLIAIPSLVFRTHVLQVLPVRKSINHTYVVETTLHHTLVFKYFLSSTSKSLGLDTKVFEPSGCQTDLSHLHKSEILVTVTQSVTNVPQTNNTSTSGMNEE